MGLFQVRNDAQEQYGDQVREQDDWKREKMAFSGSFPKD
jgi:hypothetical protein